MQKSIWSAASEVVKYNAIRPEHPVKIVDNVINFLKQKYKVQHESTSVFLAVI